MIDVQCRSCKARYRVKEELAGRVARCKHCGERMRIPYRSPVVTLDDDVAIEAEPPPPGGAHDSLVSHDEDQDGYDVASTGRRSYEEYGNTPVRAAANRRRATTADDIPEPIVPPLFSELWLPLAIVLIGYGLSLFLAGTWMLSSSGPLAGLILVGTMVVLYLAVIIPMVIRTLEGAAKTVEFDLPNAVWLQTTALLALPTLGGTIGLFVVGGFAGAAAGVMIGLILTMPLMLVLYNTSVPKALQASVLASLFYLMTLAGSAGVLTAVGLLVFPIWGMNVPWRAPQPVDVAAQNPAATAPAVALVPAPPQPPVTAATPTTQDTIFRDDDGGGSSAQPATAPADTTSPAVNWVAAIDPLPQPLRWPTDAHHLLDVRPPVHVIHAPPPSPFVALLDQDSADVYDLRTGRRVGTIREPLAPHDAMLSSGGKYLLARRAPASVAAMRERAAAAAAAAAAGDNAHFAIAPADVLVWSTADGRALTKFAAAGGGPGGARVLGFAGDDRIVTAARGMMSQPAIQVWDAPSAQLVRAIPEHVQQAYAFSPNGRYLATFADNALRAFDLVGGEAVGALELPATAAPMRTARAIAFAHDGRAVAVVGSGGVPPMRLLLWDTVDGALQGDFPLPGSVDLNITSADVHWLPDDQALLVAGEMIDRGSGRPYYKFAPPPVRGWGGAVAAVVSNYHVLCRYVPDATPRAGGSTPAQRVIFRTVALPRGELNMALRVVRGAAWSPDAAPPATLASAQAGASAVPAAAAATRPAGGGDDAAAAARAAAATTTRPVTLLERVKQREWVVSVVVVRTADVAAIEQQMETEQAKLPEIEQRFNTARVYADQLAAERTSGRDRFGRTVQVQARTNKEIGDARVVADRINEERRQVKQRVARLDREHKEALTMRTVLAKLVGDETTVQINCAGAAMVSIADGLLPDTKWKVSGGARIVENVLHIKPSSFTPAE